MGRNRNEKDRLYDLFLRYLYSFLLFLFLPFLLLSIDLGLGVHDVASNRESDDLLVCLVLAEVGSGRAVGVLRQTLAVVGVDEVAALEVLPGIRVAARVAGQDLAAGADDALVGTEQAVDVAIVTDGPDLSVGAVASSPGNRTRLVVSQALEREGVEDEAGGGDDGVGRPSHVAGDAESSGTVAGDILGPDAGVANQDLGRRASPQVLDGHGGLGVDAVRADTETVPGHGQVTGLGTLVEDGEETVTVGEGLGKDIPGSVGADEGGLLDKRVLVNGDQVLVGKELDLGVAERGDVGADDEGRREGRPQGKVAHLLVHGQAGVVGDEEVGIVEVARLLVAGEADLLAVVGHDAVPGVAEGVGLHVVRVAS